jgi:gas vesicle protein
MNNFTKGILVGVGVGVLFAPLSGKETRHVIQKRYNDWRDSLPEDSRLNQYTQQVSDRVTQTRGNLQNYAQQAVSRVKDTGNTLSNKAQQSVEQARQNVGGKKSPTNTERPGNSPTTRVMPETDRIVPQE